MQFKMGRNRPKIRGRALSLGNYIPKRYIVPPPRVDYAPRAEVALRQMYLNDNLSDCVIAGMAHAEGVFSGNVTGTPVTFTSDQIIKMYGVVGGYDINDPTTDQGCDEETALRIWETKGFAGRKPIAGWARVDTSDLNEIRTAIYEFGNLVIGVEMPDAWVNDMPTVWDGTTWGIAGLPDANNGHCMTAYNYREDAFGFSTWGTRLWITNEAVQKYLAGDAQGEAYVVITQEWVDDKSEAPNGFNYQQMISDIKSLGGNVSDS